MEHCNKQYHAAISGARGMEELKICDSVSEAAKVGVVTVPCTKSNETVVLHLAIHSHSQPPVSKREIAHSS